MYINHKDVMDFAVIKVDHIEKNSETYINKYDFIIKGEDIEKYMKYIKTFFDEFGISSRVYLSGFVCVSDSFIWSKNKITTQLMNAVNYFNNIKQNTKTYTK